MTFKELMKSAGVTQKEIAERLGFHQTLISQWQKGKTKPSVSVVLELAKILNCSAEDILKCF
jgi:transcriptional regulator with XRE-family HTH domain